MTSLGVDAPVLDKDVRTGSEQQRLHYVFVQKKKTSVPEMDDFATQEEDLVHVGI